MKGGKNPRRAERTYRAGLALLAVVYLAAFSCFATHHHANPNDNAPCLVCASASSPALEHGYTAALTPPDGPTGQVLSPDEYADPLFLPGSAGIRAPPAS